MSEQQFSAALQELESLKKRVAALEESREGIVTQLRDLKYRLDQEKKARMWIETETKWG